MEQPSMGPARHPDAELLDFLAAHGLSDLSSTLSSATLRGCAARNAASRPAFLKRLQGLGVDKLSKRQAFANALGKATRDGTLPKLSTAEVLLALGEDEAILWSEKTGEVEALLAPYDVSAQPPAPAASAQRIPRVIHYTNKTRRVGARAWRNICKTFELNPHYSFSYYDDARCEALIREHFHASVLIAFQSLRQGAAKADLWRYCCLYIHGGVYLDLDASIHGRLDASSVAPPASSGSSGSSGSSPTSSSMASARYMGGEHDEFPITPRTEQVFYYDAEANLVQWVLMVAPRHPVLHRCIQLSTHRILSREPNIFVATGPSVFTDAFIAEHSARGHAAHGGAGAQSAPVFASRTTMDWSARLNFLQTHGSVGEDSATVARVYDGYAYGDVYESGEAERYNPTWGAEPTHGLYHRLPIAMLRAAADQPPPGGKAGSGDSAMALGGTSWQPHADASSLSGAQPPAGRYEWVGEDTVAPTEDGEEGHRVVRWRCVLHLGPPLPKHRVDAAMATPSGAPILKSGAASASSATAAHATRTEEEAAAAFAHMSLPYAAARFFMEWDRATGGTESRHYLGVYRRAPGAPHQLHLFEWTAADGTEGESIEAPSVMHIDNEKCTRLELVGWQGGRSVDGLSCRLGVARRRAPAAAVEGRPLLQLPMIYAREESSCKPLSESAPPLPALS
jgi:hypothetical protein